MTRKFSSNLYSMIISQIVSAIVSFVALSLTARYLGKDNFGFFSYYLSLTTIIIKLIDFGFAPIVFRELSKTKNDFSYFNVSISFRAINFLAVQIIAFFIFVAIGYDIQFYLAFCFFMISGVLSSKSYFIRELLEIPFKANYQMKYASFFQIADNIIYLILIIICLKINASLETVILCYAISNLFGFVSIILISKKVIGVQYYFTLKNLKKLSIESFPVYIYALLETAFMQIDYIMLKTFSTNSSIGIYAASARLTAPLLIIPASLIHTFYPMLSSEKLAAKAENVNLPVFLNKVLLTYGLLLISFFSLLGKEIAILAFGKTYIAAADAAIILISAHFFLFLNYFYANLNIVLGRQKLNAYYSLLMIFANILLNLILIKNYNEIGASIAKLIASICGFIFFNIYFYQDFRNFKILNLKTILTFLLAICIFIALYFISQKTFLTISIIISIIYFVFSNYFLKKEKLFMLKLLKLKR